MSQFVQVLSDALDRERQEFFEALMASFDTQDSPPFDESCRAFLRRQFEKPTSGSVTVVPGPEVERRAREPACA